MLENAEKKDPFRADVIMKNVPKFDEKILSHVQKKYVNEGRIVNGDTVIFPNLNPFGDNHAVATFCKESYLPIESFTKRMFVDCLVVVQEYSRAILKEKNESFVTLVWNYMPPSAGSLIHPHVQILIEKTPMPELKAQLKATELYTKKNITNVILLII